MKTDFSSLELYYMIKELQPLISAKIEQIYELGRDELILQMHLPGAGKRILRILLGKMLYLASGKGEVPEKPHGFCLYLRRKLKSARLRSLRQLGFERIVEFTFETKDAKFKLIVELFSKGNIILCDTEDVILSVMQQQEWKDRILKAKQTYSYPEKEFNFLTLEKADLTKMFHASKKENLVKSLAIELGLGGVYAEEICMMAKIDKHLKPVQLSDKEISDVYEAITEIRDKDTSCAIIYRDAEGNLKDIVPFELKFYAAFSPIKSDNFNAALDSILTSKIERKDLESAEKQASTKLDKIEEMIKQQTFRIEGLEISEQENQKKGAFIYENYPLIEQAIKAIQEHRKTMSWKELKEKFKGHKIIKDIDTKTGEITLEI